MEDREEEKILLEEKELEAGRILVMYDNEQRLGDVVIHIEELDERKLVINEMNANGYNYTEKPDMNSMFVLDFLLRSAASFGETNFATSIETTFPDFFDFFKSRGFKTDDAHAFGPMNLIVHYI